MKIVLWPAFSLPNIGGLEVMVHALAKQLKSDGHQVLVISNHVNSNEYKEVIIDDIKIHLFPFIGALLSRDLRQIKVIFSQLKQLLIDFMPDVVSVHGWLESLAYYQIRVLDKIPAPMCLTIHGLLEQESYATPACVKLWNMAGSISAVSRAVIDPLAEQKLPPRDVQLIYNGLPVMDKAVDLPVAGMNLLMIGRLSNEKCFDVGFYAVKQLIHKYPDLKLTLIGGGFRYDDLLELRTKLELENVIDMLGYVRPDDVYQYIDQAHLVLIPSSYESFGLVSIQAGMRKRPVIASNVDGLPEVILNQSSGVLVPPNNPSELANAIDKLFSDKSLMQTMSQNAYDRVLDMFTIERATQQYLDMYESLLSHG